MARRKGTPEPTSEEPEDKDEKKEAKAEDAKPEAEKPSPDEVATQPINVKPDPKDLPAIVPPPPKTEPWPDATPAPMKPVEAANADTAEEPPAPRRATETLAMPIGDVGKPPEMPRTSAPPPLALGEVENPTHMPGPKEVPAGNPDDPAPAPGLVPPGDSRSLRRGDEFALIYRVGTCVVIRTGTVGTRGQWRVVEYPTYAFASNSYAKECSRLVSEGFSDYRE